eukprot:TRINITY_DN21656_c0_g1_i1.p1 TRINITY_DN21656_c0_g1~~TRINITY_DN21656_c0_g1_i1.p1  ORF type:complete len:267 (-),score=73.67 TRINITY_DN21656_c0_g1_i1:35-835(-)
MNSPSDNVFFGDLPTTLAQEDVATIFAAYGTVVSSKLLAAKGDVCSALVRYATVEEATWVVEALNGNIPEGLETPVVARFANAAGAGGKGQQTKGKGGDPYGKSAAWEPFQSTAGYGKQYGLKGAAAALFGYMAKGKGGGKPAAPGTFRELIQAAKGSGVLQSPKVPPECQVYCSNLPPDTTDLELFRLFAPFGPLAHTGCTAMMTPEGTCKGIGFVDFQDPLTAETAVASLNGLTTASGGQLNCQIKKPSLGKSGKAGKGKGADE